MAAYLAERGPDVSVLDVSPRVPGRRTPPPSRAIQRAGASRHGQVPWLASRQRSYRG
ncbi:hypothetical protein ACGFZZ_04780 [Streptomyces tendae]|uniref:hypothetical protein n=1 Tax=Streptomyces tendae TaxID=1932 RepID=UPI0033E272FA